MFILLPLICFPELSKKQVNQAKAIYDTYCLSCHGEDMDGNGEVAELLEPYQEISQNTNL